MNPISPRHVARASAILPLCALLVVGITAPAGGPPAEDETGRSAALEPIEESGRRSALPGLPRGTFVARVHYRQLRDLAALSDFDVWEYLNHEERYVLAAIDAAEYRRIEALGFRVETDRALTEEIHRVREPLPQQRAGIPAYPCYRTVEEAFDTALQIVADRPDLASWIDIGDSWEKTQALGGYDVRVLRLSNASVPGPKPRLLVASSIHGREYATAELNSRFAEYLVSRYDVDADVTWLLDHHEIHLVLYVNPDGRKQAETGILWRKNTNQDYCGATSDDRGADLNRNFEFEWGCCGGSSGSECAETYRGPSPASEPETRTLQDYMRALFPDQRGDLPTDPAPDDATGLYLDIHSYGELVLWPWAFSGTVAPNHDQLQTLGRKLAYFNGYRPQQASAPTEGTTMDFCYGDLGVASYAFELGTWFFEDCAAFENVILPANLPALIYAAKASRSPYRAPSGPDAVEIVVEPVLAEAGTVRTVTAVIDDTRFNDRNGTETSQSISAAEYYLDAPPWDASPDAAAFSPFDGAFDGPVETVIAALDSTGLAGGRHVLFVRGEDAQGNRGVVTAAFFYVADGTEGSVSGVVSDSETGLPLAATVTVPALPLGTSTDPETGGYGLVLPAGSWTLTATAPNHLTRTIEEIVVAEGGATVQDFALDPVPPILLVDDDDNDPEVLGYYTGALDALGRDYFLWDTGNSDDEPDATLLASFETVIWFTGHEYDGAAGPGAAGEAALASWLDEDGGCLLISSQDYYWDRGLTGFMQSRLGVLDAESDVEQTTVTGAGSVFSGLGPYDLDFPYSNYTDIITPGPGGELAFTGSEGDAAVSRDGGVYRTSYWGFGLEAIPTSGDRETVLGVFLGWCDSLPLADPDGDGEANVSDCAPLDGDLWSGPTAARELRISASGPGNLSWLPPEFPGAAGVWYDVLRSDTAGGFSAAGCIESNSAAKTATDEETPEPGSLFCYLVRAENGCGESLGAGSDDEERSGAVCF